MDASSGATENSWVNEASTVVLIGDAAHAMFPHAGQVISPYQPST